MNRAERRLAKKNKAPLKISDSPNQKVIFGDRICVGQFLLNHWVARLHETGEIPKDGSLELSFANGMNMAAQLVMRDWCNCNLCKEASAVFDSQIEEGSYESK